MTQDDIAALLAEAPVVAAVKDAGGLDALAGSPARVVFVLYGTVVDIALIVQAAARDGRAVFVHIDLVEGLAPRDAAVDFLVQSTACHGVISTRPALLRHAKQRGLLAIRRFFLLDSMALRTMEAQLSADTADFVEVLPGVMPKTLRRVAQLCPLPLIAGGLVSDKEDVLSALSAGAVGVSTTSAALWGA